MTAFLRIIGLAGIALTLLLVVRDAMQRGDRIAPEPLPELPHPGFPLPLEDLGEVELTLIGKSGWTIYDDVELEDGTLERAPRWRVDGMDPAPEGEGVVVRDAVVHSLSQDSGGFVLRTPRLWIPTVTGGVGPEPDRTKRWQFDRPVIEVAELFDGRAATIASESAEMDPLDDRIYGHGPFELNSGSLRLEGSELRFDPATRRVDFSPHEGAVSWRLARLDGDSVRGESDGNGFLEPAGEGSARVRFDAAERVRTFLPSAEGTAGGELRTRDLDLWLASGAAGAWLPLRADAAAPTRWQDDARLLLGGSSILAFDTSGDPASLEVTGPVRVFPGDGSLDWATARGGAWFDPRREAVQLYGGFGAQRGSNSVHGGWAMLEGGRIRAGGGIWAFGERGAARAATLRQIDESDWLAEGDARFYPAGSGLEEVGAPSILFTEDGDFETDSGFRAAGLHEGLPVEFRGAALRSRVHGDGRRTHADGALVLEREGMRLEAERMRQVGAEQLQLFGSPVLGEVALADGTAQLRSGRGDWSAGVLTLRRSPRIDAPAAALGLAGDLVQLTATDMERDADGAWKLVENVRFSGDLEGHGDEAHWNPGGGFGLVAWSETAELRGSLEDGTRFHVIAGTLRLDEQQHFVLDGDAYAQLQRPDDLTPSEIRGDHVEGDALSAFADGNASFTSPEGSGSAHRIEVRRADAEADDFEAHLIGAAQLSRDGLEASGTRIDYDASTGELIVHGDDRVAARIALDDGTVATGRLLRFDERLRIFSGDDLHLERP